MLFMQQTKLLRKKVSIEKYSITTTIKRYIKKKNKKEPKT